MFVVAQLHALLLVIEACQKSRSKTELLGVGFKVVPKQLTVQLTGQTRESNNIAVQCFRCTFNSRKWNIISIGRCKKLSKATCKPTTRLPVVETGLGVPLRRRMHDRPVSKGKQPDQLPPVFVFTILLPFFCGLQIM